MNTELKLQYIPLTGSKRSAHKLEQDDLHLGAVLSPGPLLHHPTPPDGVSEIHVQKRRRHSEGAIAGFVPQSKLKRRRPASPETYEANVKKLRCADDYSLNRSSAPPHLNATKAVEPAQSTAAQCTALAVYDGGRKLLTEPQSDNAMSSFPEMAWMKEKIRSMGSEFYVGCDRLTHTLQMGGNIKNVYDIALPLDTSKVDDEGSESDAMEAEYNNDAACMMIDECKEEDVEM